MWCEVRVLGPVDVVRDGVVIDSIAPKALELIAYLATHRDTSTAERIDDAVWAGHAPATGTDRLRGALTRARHILGDGPDGEPLVSRRATAANRLHLSDHFGTDLDRAFAAIRYAAKTDGETKVDALRTALDLVRGQPFQNLPVSWATDTDQRAIAALQDAAVDLAHTCRTSGDYDTAKWAIDRGLLLLDPHEPLYLEWARLEQARGRRDQIPAIWRRLRAQYAADAEEDATLIDTPTPETELEFREMMAAAPTN